MSIKEQQKSILHIPQDRLLTKPPIPKSVKIEITSRCNYKCQYCAISFRNGQTNKDMDWDLFKHITREMKDLGVEEIGIFYIGESFTNPKLLLASVHYLKTTLKIPYVFLTSNASLADPMITEYLMKFGLDSLKWSCNAADDEQFKQLMGVSTKNFINAKSNIRDAWKIRQERKYYTKIYASSILYNKEQLNRMAPFLQESVLPYVDEHYWLPLYTAGGQAKEKEKALGMQPIAGNTGRLDDPAEPIPCWTLFTGAHVMVDGKMTACCLDGIGNWVMGDLTKQTFMEAWHSKEFQDLRQAHINKDIIGTKCEKCALIGVN
jgi:radical SAM protein with 4Fe4S-binding SPASM domain